MKLCGKYLGDNDATCAQLTCIRDAGHDGNCDNEHGDHVENETIYISPEEFEDLVTREFEELGGESGEA